MEPYVSFVAGAFMGTVVTSTCWMMLRLHELKCEIQRNKITIIEGEKSLVLMREIIERDKEDSEVVEAELSQPLE